MAEFEILKGVSKPRIEQETIINYVREEDTWYLFTDTPKHARKWEGAIVPTDTWRGYKMYHEETGELIAIDGKIENHNVIIKKKSAPMSEEQRTLKSEQLNNVNRRGITI